MAENPLQGEVAALRRDKARLQKELHEASTENTMLRRQNYQLSALLDTAVAKLEQLGHTVVPPFDVVSSFRSLRAEQQESAAARQQASWNYDDKTAGGGLANIDGTVKNTANQTRRFKTQTELKLHRGAVLCAAFSPNAASGTDIVATGSADKSVVAWDTPSGKPVWQRQNAHESHVSDLCWSRDGRQLATVSFDSTAAVWDAEDPHSAATSTFHGKGFILSCSTLLSGAAFQFCCSDSQLYAHVVDCRDKRGSALSWANTDRVTSIVGDGDAQRVITGDTAGVVKIWDLRVVGGGPLDVSPAAGSRLSGRSPLKTGVADNFPTQPTGTPNLLHSYHNEDSGCGVSHLAAATSDDADRLLVTSDDDMVRLYERQGSGGLGMKLRNLMSGVPTRNYSIRASFRGGVRHEAQGLFEDERDAAPTHRRLTERDLVAVGGSDHVVTVFDVTARTESPVLQRLEGHQGRVYGTHFHPMQPVLVSYSADCTARVWVPGKGGQ